MVAFSRCGLWTELKALWLNRTTRTYQSCAIGHLNTLKSEKPVNEKCAINHMTAREPTDTLEMISDNLTALKSENSTSKPLCIKTNKNSTSSSCTALVSTTSFVDRHEESLFISLYFMAAAM